MMGVAQRFVIALDGTIALPTELVGGKAAQLADLTGRGLPVPAAMCVTADAYRAYLAAHALDAWLADELRRVADADPLAVGRIAAGIRRRFVEHPLPADLAGEIERGYAALPRDAASPTDPVAVRSSASSEDGRLASFAGQCETLLNVVGLPAVLDAVRVCWASLHSERALLYRRRHRLLGIESAAAVVVQRLVPADRAAIVFSANPVDGDRSAIVVNAAWGLGEAIVGGLVDPDCYVVGKDDGRIRSRQIADKAVRTVALPDGGTAEQPVPAALRRVPALRDAEVAQLAELAGHLEAAHRHPVDVECAYAGPRLAVLQCRPITTL